jgi:hypothetical protein
MMVRFQLLVVLLILLKTLPVHSVEVIEGAPYSRPAMLTEAMQLLVKSETGQKLVQQARRDRVPIRAGQISKTEIVATRVVEGTGNRSREKLHFTVQVLISQDKEPAFQALDLAHELVHAVHEKKNPFDPNMTATDYVEHGIEGQGGEAQAIAQECQVGQELSKNGAIQDASTLKLIQARCQTVWKLGRDESKWKKSFYQLGQYYRGFVKEWLATRPQEQSVESWKEKLAARSPLFSSASAHKPYPVALLEEYIEITRIICAKALGSKSRCSALPPSSPE